MLYLLASSLCPSVSVPIYDGRNALFDVCASSIQKINDLRRYDGELPVGSLVVVGYVMSAYKSANANNNGMFIASPSINWVIVLGDQN